MLSVEGGKDSGFGLGYEGKRGGMVGCDLRVYNAHHAVLTVFGPAAVVPDGAGVVDHDGEGGPHGVAGLHGHEAGEEAASAGVVVLDRLARLVEGGLHDAVALVVR